MKTALRWWVDENLLDTDLPVGLQVFWKLLMAAWVTTVAYATTTLPSTTPDAVLGLLYAFSAFGFFGMLFTRLGG